MRERLARLIALLTGLLILLLVMIFAFIQNPRQNPKNSQNSQNPMVSHNNDTAEKKEQPLHSPETKELDAVKPDLIKAGRQVYDEQGCARCHSIAGKGNLRNPIDSVGTRLNAKELRDWVVGADSLKGVLPEGILNFKKSYRELPVEDLNVLIIYLQSLR